MATPVLTSSQDSSITRPRVSAHLYNWMLIGASFWLIGGGYLDAWAHMNIPSLETFFTPWHAVIYSGLLAVILIQGVSILINRLNGSTWREAIPPTHYLTLFATAGFFAGGIGDMIWHNLFGIEVNIDGLLSPTHMALFICLLLIALGPYRTLYQQTENRQTRWMLPIVQILLLGAANLFLSAIHPFLYLYPSTIPTNQPDNQLLAVISYLFYGVVLTVITLYSLRRWRVPIGFFTAVYLVTGIAESLLQGHTIVILIALIQGILTDAIYQFLKPTIKRPEALRIFAFLSMLIFYGVYFAVLSLTSGVIWTIHLSMGTIVGSALLAWMLTYLMIPSQPAPEQHTAE